MAVALGGTAVLVGEAGAVGLASVVEVVAAPVVGVVSEGPAEVVTDRSRTSGATCGAGVPHAATVLTSSVSPAVLAAR
ncbi:MAG: hypothetical protein ABJA74_15225 [Lapillicoccus sp.]